MGAEILLASLAEFIAIERDYAAGQAEKEQLDAVKKRLSQSLMEFVDYRVEASLTRRRNEKSQERVALADTINSAVKNAAASVRSMRALSTAPPPPAGDDPDAMKEWREAYEEWYRTIREEGVTIK